MLIKNYTGQDGTAVPLSTLTPGQTYIYPGDDSLAIVMNGYPNVPAGQVAVCRLDTGACFTVSGVAQVIPVNAVVQF